MFAESSPLAWFYEETFRWGRHEEGLASCECGKVQSDSMGLGPDKGGLVRVLSEGRKPAQI